MEVEVNLLSVQYDYFLYEITWTTYFLSIDITGTWGKLLKVTWVEKEIGLNLNAVKVKIMLSMQPPPTSVQHCIPLHTYWNHKKGHNEED